MKRYTQLAREQRYQIHALLKAGHNQSQIAMILGCHRSTISRELRRNRGLRGYRPKQADQLAMNRRAEKVRPRLQFEHWTLVERLLREDWSPEQVSLWLAKERHPTVSHEWIYQYVLAGKGQGGDLYRHLRCRSPQPGAG